MRRGETSANHLIGPEGFVGFVGDLTLPNVTIAMLVEGSAMCIDAAVLLEELQKPGLLQLIMRRYAHARMSEVTQAAACNAVHCIQERLACWLLLIADRVGKDFRITHETIANMLGSRRATVTLQAESFQRMGLISYRYGTLHLIDRDRLQKLACECYEIRRSVVEEVFKI